MTSNGEGWAKGEEEQHGEKTYYGHRIRRQMIESLLEGEKWLCEKLDDRQPFV